MHKIGSIAFLVGVAVCVIAGFVTMHWMLPVLTILGLAVGFLNVSTREMQTFVFVAIGLVLISALATPQIRSIPEVGPTLSRIYLALLLFLAPAATVVALRGLFLIAKR
jgi:hypothetical protein